MSILKGADGPFLKSFHVTITPPFISDVKRGLYWLVGDEQTTTPFVAATNVPSLFIRWAKISN